MPEPDCAHARARLRAVVPWDVPSIWVCALYQRDRVKPVASSNGGADAIKRECFLGVVYGREAIDVVLRDRESQSRHIALIFAMPRAGGVTVGANALASASFAK